MRSEKLQVNNKIWQAHTESITIDVDENWNGTMVQEDLIDNDLEDIHDNDQQDQIIGCPQSSIVYFGHFCVIHLVICHNEAEYEINSGHEVTIISQPLVRHNLIARISDYATKSHSNQPIIPENVLANEKVLEFLLRFVKPIRWPIHVQNSVFTFANEMQFSLWLHCIRNRTQIANNRDYCSLENTNLTLFLN